MSEDRIHTYNAAVQSGTKFDYWIATLTGAVIAYLMKEYPHGHFEPCNVPLFVVWLLETSALGLLIISFLHSYRRIASQYEYLEMNHQLADNTHIIEKMRGVPTEVIDDFTYGESMTAAQKQERIKKLQDENKVIRKRMEIELAKGKVPYFRRFQFFIAGLVVLMIAKFLLFFL